jgi:hypothetical protein
MSMVNFMHQITKIETHQSKHKLHKSDKVSQEIHIYFLPIFLAHGNIMKITRKSIENNVEN